MAELAMNSERATAVRETVPFIEGSLLNFGIPEVDWRVWRKGVD